MASAAQVLANHANAQLSTGPKTDAGKASASRNNLKHGLTLGVLTLSPDEQKQFCEFEAKLRAECLPVGALECEVFEQFLDGAARISKIRRIVGDMIEKYNDDPLLQPETEATYRQLDRYRGAAEMTVYRAVKTLRELQTTRLFREFHVTKDEQDVVPPLVNPGEKFWCGGEMRMAHNDRELFYHIYGPEPLTSRFPTPTPGARVQAF